MCDITVLYRLFAIYPFLQTDNAHRIGPTPVLPQFIFLLDIILDYSPSLYLTRGFLVVGAKNIVKGQWQEIFDR